MPKGVSDRKRRQNIRETNDMSDRDKRVDRCMVSALSIFADPDSRERGDVPESTTIDEEEDTS